MGPSDDDVDRERRPTGWTGVSDKLTRMWKLMDAEYRVNSFKVMGHFSNSSF